STIQHAPHNRAASILLRPPSPLQILIPPFEFTSPTPPASACRAFAENLFEQLHGAEAEVVRNFDEALQSRRSTRFPYYGWHSALPLIPFRLNPPFHLESLVFHPNCLSPHFKFYLLSYPLPNFPLPSDNVNSASSFPRYRHAKSSLHC
ncbi:hypothetical protein K443DRAFT_114787, partial [Laccaria amethystina LaAM-08-1]